LLFLGQRLSFESLTLAGGGGGTLALAVGIQKSNDKMIEFAFHAPRFI